MTYTPTYPPVCEESTNDLETNSSFSESSSSPRGGRKAKTVNDRETTNYQSSSSPMTVPPSRRSSSSFSELNNNTTTTDKDDDCCSLSSSNDEFEETSIFSYVDLNAQADAAEEPTFISTDSSNSSKATTNHAVCNPSSPKRRQRRRRQVKPQTPRERWCCCGHDAADNDIAYYDDFDHDGPNNEYVYDNDNNDDNSCCGTGVLRYCRLLPPTAAAKEHPIKKKIRHLLWWTILLDLAVALTACLSFDDQQLMCCGEPIFTIPGVENLDQVIRIVLYVYLGVVVVQILPVVREGCIPWNLMNPIFGFCLGFVLFFVNDDAPMAALCIWILQIISVALEFVTYRHYLILHGESKKRLERANAQLLVAQKQSPRRGYQQSKRERVRRELQNRHVKSLYRLRKHLIGVSINILLVIATLLLIVYVAKQGGMCVKDSGTPSLFLFNNSDNDEMECTNSSEGKRYAICDIDSGESECYFPFF
mmetsp:Transcript_26472/g.64503  ORF Transcript_26472/g.64503 Transcript_26472/m.64503 type:complete len:477 (-) Transcript_26472:531-1961(-)